MGVSDIAFFLGAVVACFVLTGLLGLAARGWPPGLVRLAFINAASFFIVAWAYALVRSENGMAHVSALYFCLVPQLLVFIFSLGAYFQTGLFKSRKIARPRARPANGKAPTAVERGASHES